MAQTLREWLTPIGVIAGIAFLAWFVWDDMDRLRGDVHSIEVRIAVLESDFSYIKSDVAELKGDVAELKEDVASLDARVARIEQDVAQIPYIREDIAEIRAILLNLQQTGFGGDNADTPSAAQPSGPAVTRNASEQP